MTYIPPVISPPPGIDYQAENEVKANLFGNLAGLGVAIAGHRDAKRKLKEARSRGAELADKLAKFDARFAPFRQDIIDSGVSDPNKRFDTVKDLYGMFSTNDLKTKLGELSAHLKEQQHKDAVKQVSDATKKDFDNEGQGYATKEEAQRVLDSHLPSLQLLGLDAQVVGGEEEPGLMGSIARLLPGGNTGVKPYSIKTRFLGKGNNPVEPGSSDSLDLWINGLK